jgi:hypothetical protein
MRHMLAFFSIFLFSVSASAAIPSILSGRILNQQGSALEKKISETPATLVVFLSAKCPCSAAHETSLRELHTRYGDRIPFVAVHSNQDESDAEASAHFRAAAFPFPVLADRREGADRELLADQFGALKTPHAFLVDASGTVLFSGGIDDSKDPKKAKRRYLADALAAAVEGREPPTKEARTLGCVINR